MVLLYHVPFPIAVVIILDSTRLSFSFFLSNIQSPGQATNQINITANGSLCYGSENWIISKRDAQKVEAAQMRFLIPLLRLTRLDRQRIRNRLKEDNTVRDIKLYQEKWLDHLERMGRNHLPKLPFQYQPLGRRVMGRARRRWRNQEHLEL
jgi:hypothetical protein